MNPSIEPERGLLRNAGEPSAQKEKSQALIDLEIDLLLEAIKRHYGYDFNNYARASLKRRVEHHRVSSGSDNITVMISRLLHDEGFFSKFLLDMSITVTEMFRDPDFFKSFRENVIPIIKKYPSIKIWHAGCATGEEVYSMAILLMEEGLYERVQIYATDFNKQSLITANEGIYPADRIKKYTSNYHQAGGKSSFSDYYHSHYRSAKFDKSLKEKIIFSHHNLEKDGVFSEVNVVICRNVLIYFNQVLQNQVLNTFEQSLSHRGVLCLGSHESVNCSDIATRVEIIDQDMKMFRVNPNPQDKRHELINSQCQTDIFETHLS